MFQTWSNTIPALLTLETKLKCFICEKLPVNPHILWCKHSFCKECVLKLSHCPNCNFSVTPQDLMPDIMLNHLLNVMKITSEIINGPIVENNKSTTLVHGKYNNKGHNKPNLNIKNQEKNINSFPSKKQKLNTNVKKVQPNEIMKNCELNKRTPRNSIKSSSEIDQTPLLDTRKKRVMDYTANDVKEHKVSTSKIKFSKSPKQSILFSAKKTSMNKVNAKGESSLQIACRQGKLTLVKKLLADGAEPNVKDYANWTPLCDAVGSGDMNIVKELISAGAAINTPSNLNTTALVESVLRHDEAMVLLLMEHGADPNQRTALDNTAMSLADEKLKQVMLSVTKVPICPHPRVCPTPRAVLALNLSEEHMKSVMDFCRSFNLTLSTAFSEDITHVIVNKTDDGLCRASVSVMLSIANGCSVAGLDWVVTSMNRKELLPVDEYEPSGTIDHPHSGAFRRARLNREQLLPRLFDGCHISLTQEQVWPVAHRSDLVSLVMAAGAQYQSRACDAERIPLSEQTVMFHAPSHSPLYRTSHLVLYQPGNNEPLLKYNMIHVKSLSVAWFLQCIKTFSIL